MGGLSERKSVRETCPETRLWRGAHWGLAQRMELCLFPGRKGRGLRGALSWARQVMLGPDLPPGPPGGPGLGLGRQGRDPAVLYPLLLPVSSWLCSLGPSPPLVAATPGFQEFQEGWALQEVKWGGYTWRQRGLL